MHAKSIPIEFCISLPSKAPYLLFCDRAPHRANQPRKNQKFLPRQVVKRLPGAGDVEFVMLDAEITVVVDGVFVARDVKRYAFPCPFISQHLFFLRPVSLADRKSIRLYSSHVKISY